ncbi:protein CANDIDATE G-PROTEIN COUPLED RECEPTOR 2 [Cucumis sativus]|uniref:Transmembrane protein adipocyte-associated 1 n=1 Tax=Cucumis sativus TaxID=3659 RepID=A0A0A0LSU2_CUCSA|nr:protein CANDIDATE G-PROTEIN COUPLED RECEPTOR 2 [Cucumis sativus]KGN64044.1 hypothetical protein Csa_013150 [Cucumis sativus]
MGTILLPVFSSSDALSPIGSFSSQLNGDVRGLTAASSGCHGMWYSALLVAPSVLFAIYLAISAIRNIKKFFLGRSFIMISYYALLWITTLLNLAWCSLQEWECSPGKKFLWNLLSLFTLSGMLFLEISLVAFLLKANYSGGMEALLHNFIVSGTLVGVDVLLKVIYVFGFGIPLFIGVGSSHWSKWGVWTIHKLLLTAAYGFILFVHFSKWRDKLPPRPSFYNYIAVMFVVSALAFFASGLSAFGVRFGIWLYNFTVISYHSMYLPFLYVTFLADFFQEEDFLLENAYYSEMRDAGFFDSEWD